MFRSKWEGFSHPFDIRQKWFRIKRPFLRGVTSFVKHLLFVKGNKLYKYFRDRRKKSKRIGIYHGFFVFKRATLFLNSPIFRVLILKGFFLLLLRWLKSPLTIEPFWSFGHRKDTQTKKPSFHLSNGARLSIERIIYFVSSLGSDLTSTASFVAVAFSLAVTASLSAMILRR